MGMTRERWEEVGSQQLTQLGNGLWVRRSGHACIYSCVCTYLSTPFPQGLVCALVYSKQSVKRSSLGMEATECGLSTMLLHLLGNAGAAHQRGKGKKETCPVLRMSRHPWPLLETCLSSGVCMHFPWVWVHWLFLEAGDAAEFSELEISLAPVA